MDSVSHIAFLSSSALWLTANVDCILQHRMAFCCLLQCVCADLHLHRLFTSSTSRGLGCTVLFSERELAFTFAICHRSAVCHL